MIHIQNLSFQYKKNKPLFQDFSLGIDSGSIVGLLGKNGAGKSTLLQLMAGLIAPKQGAVNINGFVPFERKPAFLSDIYMVPEEFTFPSISMACYVNAFSPLYPAFDQEKLARIFSEFELTLSDKLNQLSHGQRKKFLIAFALATNCKVLVLDEPTNGLDIPSKSQFRKILVSSITDEQLVIISTHQVKDIDTIIDKVVVIDEGELLYHKDTAEVTQSYNFNIVSSVAEIDNVLYSETCPQGYKIVTAAKEDEESDMDLEMLFNAITHKKIRN